MMNLKMYCSMYNEFLKLFAHLGQAVKLAFSGKLYTILKVIYFLFKFRYQ